MANATNTPRPSDVPAHATCGDEYRLIVTDAQGRSTDELVGRDRESAIAYARKVRDALAKSANVYQMRLYRAKVWYWTEVDKSEDGEGEIVRYRLVRPPIFRPAA